mmetsp:Transcript_24651/g.24391  ORF Transcript_24651/g.24391 Transcript_24651/m.24391 type:complete len:120 (+) Transcript_24651:17-376(+)
MNGTASGLISFIFLNVLIPPLLFNGPAVPTLSINSSDISSSFNGEREFVRHCNYWLQCDAPPEPQSNSRALYEGDTAWLFVNAESCRDRLGDLWMHVVAPKAYEKIEAQIVKCRAAFLK